MRPGECSVALGKEERSGRLGDFSGSKECGFTAGVLSSAWDLSCCHFVIKAPSGFTFGQDENRT